MMTFGVVWIVFLLILLLVIAVPVVLLILLLFRPGLQGKFRDPHQPGSMPPRVDYPPEEVDNPSGPEPLEIQCAHCGATLQPEWTHCPNCGAPVG